MKLREELWQGPGALLTSELGHCGSPSFRAPSPCTFGNILASTLTSLCSRSAGYWESILKTLAIFTSAIMLRVKAQIDAVKP